MPHVDSPDVLILAAGLGKRMKSSLPKVLQEIGGQPLLFHILDRVCEELPKARVGIVVGYQKELVEKRVKECAKFSALQISFIHQTEQLGTGHAARCAMDSPWGQAAAKSKRPVLVLPGDQPLITTRLIHEMSEPLKTTEAMRLLTCEIQNPTGYGRIVRRGKKGPVMRIVEEKDATAREKLIHEVGTSVYLFQSAFLKAGLARLSNKNAQGEYYLTDLVAQATSARKKVDVYIWQQCDDLRGINDPWELAQAGEVLNQRILSRWAKEGVRFVAPHSTWVEADVVLGAEVIIEPGVYLKGQTRVGDGARIKAGTVVEDSEIGPHSQVGPYAHFRPGSKTGAKVKIGNFVELKKTTIDDETSVAHLSYLGDAEVGKRVNVGCGFVTCNFDGRVINGSRKHKTIIEDEAFIGSDCQAIAPIRIGKGSYIASGSTITHDVEADALAFGRARQVTKSGYAKKLRSKNSGEGQAK